MVLTRSVTSDGSQSSWLCSTSGEASYGLADGQDGSSLSCSNPPISTPLARSATVEPAVGRHWRATTEVFWGIMGNLLVVALFCLPTRHKKNIDRVCSSKTLAWSEMVDGLIHEWEITLLVAVPTFFTEIYLFGCIKVLANNSALTPVIRAGATASACSVTYAMGSIVCGFACRQQYMRRSFARIPDCLDGPNGSTLAAGLAVKYSTPLALLIWSLLLFTIGVVLLFYETASLTPFTLLLFPLFPVLLSRFLRLHRPLPASSRLPMIQSA